MSLWYSRNKNRFKLGEAVVLRVC